MVRIYYFLLDYLIDLHSNIGVLGLFDLWIPNPDVRGSSPLGDTTQFEFKLL